MQPISWKKAGAIMMPRKVAAIFASACIVAASPAVAQPGLCTPGVYGIGPEAFVIIGGPVQPASAGQRYLFLDGTRGATGEDRTRITCSHDSVRVHGTRDSKWGRIALREADISFESAGTELFGRLIEPDVDRNAKVPLVVMVHGSEKTSAIGNVYGYMLAAQGIAVFVYDKRGTGVSGGEYTQNFELLADDASAALVTARKAAAGRFSRAGFFGGSQGGWVAPLAASQTEADFVAVGFGLVVSPIEEDREQLLDEAKQLGLGAKGRALVERLSDATARLLRSNFQQGFDELAAVRADMPFEWTDKLNGEHSGQMLRTSDADLRRIGRARFDNLELLWDYDSAAVLRRLDVPLLWVLAADDREAPITRTRAMLSALIAAGQPVEAFVFPDTDHGMVEFEQAADGSRKVTRITDGYLKLLADWIKQDDAGQYGRSERIR